MGCEMASSIVDRPDNNITFSSGPIEGLDTINDELALWFWGFGGIGGKTYSTVPNILWEFGDSYRLINVASVIADVVET